MRKALRPKSLSDVTYENEYEALHVLGQLLKAIIEKDFKNDKNTLTYVLKRIEGAREVLKRRSKDYFTQYELRSAVAPSDARMKSSLTIKVRNLEGKETYVEPEHNVWYSVKVSRFRLKCTCQDALMLSSIADKRFKKALIKAGIHRFPRAEPVFYKYVICKHTLAKAATAMAGKGDVGVLNIDREFIDTLRIALYAVYLRVNDDPDPEITKKIYRIIRGRMRR